MATHQVPERALWQLSQVLAPWEQSRAERYLRPSDRRDYLCAHVLRRALLSYCFERPEQEWDFEPDDFGKPIVLNREPRGRIECNLSHTGGVVAAIAAIDHAVGIDVERLDRPMELDIAAILCSCVEEAAVRAAPQSRQREQLLQLWVQKEALVKAVGRGLSMDLSQIAFDDDGFAVLSRPVPGMERPADWQVWKLATVPNTLLAAAVHGRGHHLRIQCTQINWMQLCEPCMVNSGEH